MAFLRIVASFVVVPVAVVLHATTGQTAYEAAAVHNVTAGVTHSLTKRTGLHVQVLRSSTRKLLAVLFKNREVFADALHQVSDENGRVTFEPWWDCVTNMTKLEAATKSARKQTTSNAEEDAHGDQNPFRMFDAMNKDLAENTVLTALEALQLAMTGALDTTGSLAVLRDEGLDHPAPMQNLKRKGRASLLRVQSLQPALMAADISGLTHSRGSVMVTSPKFTAKNPLISPKTQVADEAKGEPTNREGDSSPPRVPANEVPEIVDRARETYCDHAENKGFAVDTALRQNDAHAAELFGQLLFGAIVALQVAMAL